MAIRDNIVFCPISTDTNISPVHGAEEKEPESVPDSSSFNSHRSTQVCLRLSVNVIGQEGLGMSVLNAQLAPVELR